MLEEGAMTVQLYERSTQTLQSVERGEAETRVLAVVISHGDKMIQVGLDQERNTWEVEVVGQSAVHHA